MWMMEVHFQFAYETHTPFKWTTDNGFDVTKYNCPFYRWPRPITWRGHAETDVNNWTHINSADRSKQSSRHVLCAMVAGMLRDTVVFFLQLNQVSYWWVFITFIVRPIYWPPPTDSTYSGDFSECLLWFCAISPLFSFLIPSHASFSAVFGNPLIRITWIPDSKEINRSSRFCPVSRRYWDQDRLTAIAFW